MDFFFCTLTFESEGSLAPVTLWDSTASVGCTKYKFSRSITSPGCFINTEDSHILLIWHTYFFHILRRKEVCIFGCKDCFMCSHNNMNKSFFSLFCKLAALVRHRISLFGKTSQSIQILKKKNHFAWRISFHWFCSFRKWLIHHGELLTHPVTLTGLQVVSKISVQHESVNGGWCPSCFDLILFLP